MKFLWVVFILTLGLGRLWAAEPLSLQRAQELALEHNPLLKAAQAQVEAAQAGVEVARSRFLPRLDVKEVYQRSDSPVYVFSSKLAQQYFRKEDFELERLNHPSPRTDIITEVSITQPIFNRGQEIVGYRKAKIHEKMAHLYHLGVRQRVLFETERAFLEWLLTQERVQVISSALKTAKANLKVVKARVETGVALRSDLLQAQVFSAAQERELLAAQNQAEVARSRLNLVLGLPLKTLWEPLKVQIELEKPLKPLSFWLNEALKRRPDLLAEAARLELAHEEVRGAKLNFGPAINLRGMYEYHANNFHGVSGDAFTFMAQADFNLFHGLGDKARLAQARAEELSQERKLANYRQKVKHEVEKAYLHLQTARKQVYVTKTAVEQAEEGLRIVEKRYQQGLTIIVELLDAQTALKKARLHYLDALYSYRLAWTELRFRTGTLGEEND